MSTLYLRCRFQYLCLHHIHQVMEPPNIFHFSTSEETIIPKTLWLYVVINICLPFLHFNYEFVHIVMTGFWDCCMFTIFYQTIPSITCLQVDYFNSHVMYSWTYLSEAVSEVIIPDPCYACLNMSSMLRNNIPIGHVGVVVFWSLHWGIYESINYHHYNLSCVMGLFIYIIIITIRKSNFSQS